jgi:hypothetical protein
MLVGGKNGGGGSGCLFEFLPRGRSEGGGGRRSLVSFLAPTATVPKVADNAAGSNNTQRFRSSVLLLPGYAPIILRTSSPPLLRIRLVKSDSIHDTTYL